MSKAKVSHKYLAKLLASHRTGEADDPVDKELAEIALELAEHFREGSQGGFFHFDVGEFLSACGVEDYPVCDHCGGLHSIAHCGLWVDPPQEAESPYAPQGETPDWAI